MLRNTIILRIVGGWGMAPASPLPDTVPANHRTGKFEEVQPSGALGRDPLLTYELPPTQRIDSPDGPPPPPQTDSPTVVEFNPSVFEPQNDMRNSSVGIARLNILPPLGERPPISTIYYRATICDCPTLTLL